MRILIIFFVSAVLFSACDDGRVYENNYDFEDRYWLVRDQPSFEFEIKDTTVRYNLYCNVRNTVSFPYSRLFIKYYLADSLSGPAEKQLVEKFLFDKSTGKPQGSSGLGDIYDQRIPLIQNHRFARSGKYKVKFEQFMRTDTLPGILAVGLRVEKATVK
jgi:gliding motility-associated lipoprotein GldH